MEKREMDLKELCLEVVDVARNVGDYILEELTGFNVGSEEKKNPHDYVTYVDKASEKKLIQSLSGLLDSCGFIAEEGSASWNGEEYVWVVDPLDGTTNYIHNMGYYCVSIALRRNRELLLGVIFDPNRRECFYSWKGAGCTYINGVAHRVSAHPSLDEAMVVAEQPYNMEDYKNCGLNLITHFMGRVAGIRMIGSAALAICYVAVGRVDAWMEAFVKPWDYSAAALMLLESGGRVSDFYGGVDFVDSVHIVATNGLLHQEILNILSESYPKGI